MYRFNEIGVVSSPNTVSRDRNDAVLASYQRAPIHTCPVAGSVQSPWYPTWGLKVPVMVSGSP